jgi:hypothetical protein
MRRQRDSDGMRPSKYDRPNEQQILHRMSHIRKQKPYGSKMEKFDVVGRSSRCSQSTDKHLH